MPSPITGQIALSGVAQPLSPPLQTTPKAYVIIAPFTNTHVVYLGNSSVTSGSGFRLSPGDSVTYEQSNQNGEIMFNLCVSDFYAVGTTGDVLTWLGSP